MRGVALRLTNCHRSGVQLRADIWLLFGLLGTQARLLSREQILAGDITAGLEFGTSVQADLQIIAGPGV
jgi:hypothetical protein